MSVRSKIEHTLTEGLAPTRLVIIDDSARHHGHGGARPEGESHFIVEIVSPAFDGKSRVARQQMVYALLAELLREQIHALGLTTLTPAEDSARQV